jgi:hypothetical protein
MWFRVKRKEFLGILVKGANARCIYIYRIIDATFRAMDLGSGVKVKGRMMQGSGFEVRI